MKKIYIFLMSVLFAISSIAQILLRATFAIFNYMFINHIQSGIYTVQVMHNDEIMNTRVSVIK